MIKYNESGVINGDSAYDGPAGFQNHSSNLSAIETWFAVNSPTASTLGTFATLRNTVYAVSFWTPRTNTYIDRVAINVTTGVAGSGMIGIYSNCSDTVIYPSSLLYATPEFSNTSTAVKPTNVGIKLDPGSLYWLIYHGNSAVTVRAVTSNVGGWRNPGFDSDMYPINSYRVGRTYDGSLPNVYAPLGPTGVFLPGRAYPTGAVSAAGPVIYVRYAQ